MKQEHGCSVASVRVVCLILQPAVTERGRYSITGGQRDTRVDLKRGDALVLRTVITELRGYSGKRDAASEGGG